MENEYELEKDMPLMDAINHFASLSNNDSYKYKFIEIMRRIEYEDVVYLNDLKLLEKEFKCPIRVQLIKGSGFYLDAEIHTFTELNRFLGMCRGKRRKNGLDFNRLRNAITALI